MGGREGGREEKKKKLGGTERKREKGKEGKSKDEEGKRRETSDVKQRSNLKRRGQIKQMGDKRERYRTQRCRRHHTHEIRDRKRGSSTDVTLAGGEKKENQQRPVIENRLKGSEGGEQGGINY